MKRSRKLFTSSGSWTCPPGVTNIKITLISGAGVTFGDGGGGSGGGFNNGGTTGGNGGNGAYNTAGGIGNTNAINLQAINAGNTGNTIIYTGGISSFSNLGIQNSVNNTFKIIPLISSVSLSIPYSYNIGLPGIGGAGRTTASTGFIGTNGGSTSYSFTPTSYLITPSICSGGGGGGSGGGGGTVEAGNNASLSGGNGGNGGISGNGFATSIKSTIPQQSYLIVIGAAQSAPSSSGGGGGGGGGGGPTGSPGGNGLPGNINGTGGTGGTRSGGQVEEAEDQGEQIMYQDQMVLLF